MDWWAKFDLWKFIIHPMGWLPPTIDLWLAEWGNWIDLFIKTNPWFCTIMSGGGVGWLTWLVMKTPWTWDDSWPATVKTWWGKMMRKENPKKDKAMVSKRLEKELHKLVDEVKETPEVKS